MMDCKSASELLEALLEGSLTVTDRAAVEEHLRSCDSCASAWRALKMLRAHGRTAAPTPRPDLFSEVMAHATHDLAAQRRVPGGRFWLGAGIGGALAASIVFALLSFNLPLQERSSPTPHLTIALNETQNVNVAIDSPQILEGANIRVLLTGAVALAGFEGQTEINWSTNLDRGVNMLSLPVTMQGLSGGRVLVEVNHEDRHEIFVVDLQGSPEVGASTRPEPVFGNPTETQV